MNRNKHQLISNANSSNNVSVLILLPPPPKNNIHASEFITFLDYLINQKGK